MLSFKIRNILKPESLQIDDKLYLTAKTCTCNACMGFKQQFIANCSKQKLDYLNSI